jgi:hypothetical protein
VVAKVPPLLEDGTPFPTTYWLTCPLAMIRIGRVESIGGVRRVERWIEADEERSARLAAAHDRYRRDRDRMLEQDARVATAAAPSGGVAGCRAGVKCLHAHYADHAAGNDNIVGGHVAAFVEPLDCTTACVEDSTRNPAWREPK